MVVPEWFKHKYPVLARNLMANQDRVVSPFDLHNTLHYILNLNKQPPGTSLMSKLRPQRTCVEAGEVFLAKVLLFEISLVLSLCWFQIYNTMRSIKQHVPRFFRTMREKQRCSPTTLTRGGGSPSWYPADGWGRN